MEMLVTKGMENCTVLHSWLMMMGGQLLTTWNHTKMMKK